MSTTTTQTLTSTQPGAAPSGPEVISTTLRYSTLPPNGEKPYTNINPSDDPAKPRTNTGVNDVPLDIKNLRHVSPDFYGTDKTGFDFFRWPTSMQYEEWANDDIIRSKYYEEVIDLLKKKTGAHTVHIFDHTVRRLPPKGVTIPDTPETRQPVSGVHVDQTRSSAFNRVRRHMPEEDYESLSSGRYRLINVWRPFHTVYDAPLAVADFNTLDTKSDLAATDLVYPDRLGEVSTITFNPNHQWYSPSQMEKDEVLLLKCFDNKDGVAIMTPHTAFRDPKYYDVDGVPRRESIELRCLVFGGQ